MQVFSNRHVARNLWSHIVFALRTVQTIGPKEERVGLWDQITSLCHVPCLILIFQAS